MLSYLTFLCCEDPYGGPENLLDICIVVVLTKKEKVKYQLEQYKTSQERQNNTIQIQHK
jgi:hypothetical protein